MAYMKGNIRKKVEIGYVNAPTQADIKKGTEILLLPQTQKLSKLLYVWYSVKAGDTTWIETGSIVEISSS